MILKKRDARAKATQRLYESFWEERENSDIYPVTEARERITDFVQNAPLLIEAMGILFGDSVTHFTKVAIPKVLGIRESADLGQGTLASASWNDRARKVLLDDMVQTSYHHTNVYLAVREDTHEVGVQVLSRIPEADAGMNNLTCNFIPEAQLILQKSLIEYLPESERVHFADNSIPLVDRILQQNNTANLLDIASCYNVPLEIGQVGTDHSASIFNSELARIAKMNQVDGGTLIGLTHPHSKRTQAEIDSNEFLRELMEIVEDHESYITPADAAFVLAMPDRLLAATGTDKYIQVATMGALLHDRETREFISEKYLDVIALYNSEDWERFQEITVIAQKSGELEPLKEFYAIVKAYTLEGRPKIASPDLESHMMSSEIRTALRSLIDAYSELSTRVELDEETELDLWRVMGFDRVLEQSTPFDSYDIFTQTVETTYREMIVQQNALGVYFPAVKRGMLFPRAGYANILEILVNQDQSDFAHEFAKVVTGANHDPAVAAELADVFERIDS